MGRKMNKRRPPKVASARSTKSPPNTGGVLPPPHNEGKGTKAAVVVDPAAAGGNDPLPPPSRWPRFSRHAKTWVPIIISVAALLVSGAQFYLDKLSVDRSLDVVIEGLDYSVARVAEGEDHSTLYPPDAGDPTSVRWGRVSSTASLVLINSGNRQGVLLKAYLLFVPNTKLRCENLDLRPDAFNISQKRLFTDTMDGLPYTFKAAQVVQPGAIVVAEGSVTNQIFFWGEAKNNSIGANVCLGLIALDDVGQIYVRVVDIGDVGASAQKPKQYEDKILHSYNGTYPKKVSLYKGKRIVSENSPGS